MARPQTSLLRGIGGSLYASNPPGVGTLGALPALWNSFFNAGGSLAWSHVGFGTENGIPYADMRLSGTSGAGSPDAQIYPGSDFVAAAQGQLFTSLFWCKRVAGLMTNVAYALAAFNEFDSGSGYLTGSYPSITIPVNVPLNDASCRMHNEYTVANAATARANAALVLGINASAAVDVTLRIGWLSLFAGRIGR